MNIKNKKILFNIMSLILLIVGLCGISYAMYIATGTGSKENVITTGNIVINYEQTNRIQLTNEYPQSDELGLAEQGMNFSVSSNIVSNSVQVVGYAIALDSITPGATLTNEYVKLSLRKAGSLTSLFATPKTVSEIKTNAAVANEEIKIRNYVIHQDSFTTSEIHNYNLKAWVSDEYNLPTTNTSSGTTHGNQTTNEEYAFKIKIVSIDDMVEIVPVYNDASGTSKVELLLATNSNLIDYKIFGNSIQDGMPTSASPKPVISLGEGGSLNVITSGKNFAGPVNGVYDGIIVNNGRITFPSTPLLRNVNIPFDFSEISAGETVTLSWSTGVISSIGASCFRILLNDMTIYSLWGNWEKRTYALNSNVASAYMNVNKDDIELLDKTISVQAEKGTTKTMYEQYHEPINTTIDITGHEPLRKIGEVSDYIDYANSKIVRKIGKIASYNGESITTSYISTAGSLTNGATVYYVLTTPTEEVISLPSIPAFEKTTILEIDNTPTSSNMDIRYLSSE